MNKKYTLTIVSIGIIAVLTYYLLGGFKKPNFQIQNQIESTIYGSYYEGTIGSDSLQSLFLQARALVTNNNDLEAIAIAYYGAVNEDNGLVRNFVGVAINNDEISLDLLNWETRTFRAQKSVKACIEANVLAMPTPEDMLSDLKKYGEENNIKADTIFIEYYAGPNNLCVELLGS